MPRKIAGSLGAPQREELALVHRSRLASTARKLTAFATKQKPSPIAAITMPPSAGPNTRDALKRLELSAIAFGSSAGRPSGT